jgi:3-methyladenine DNA glycosylase Tag
LFEYLILEGAHASLSWLTILNKRETYRLAYDDFDPKIVVKYDENKILELLENKGIVRHKVFSF